MVKHVLSKTRKVSKMGVDQRTTRLIAFRRTLFQRGILSHTAIWPVAITYINHYKIKHRKSSINRF
jgi:hypothetical protein